MLCSSFKAIFGAFSKFELRPLFVLNLLIVLSPLVALATETVQELAKEEGEATKA